MSVKVTFSEAGKYMISGGAFSLNGAVRGIIPTALDLQKGDQVEFLDDNVGTERGPTVSISLIDKSLTGR